MRHCPTIERLRRDVTVGCGKSLKGSLTCNFAIRIESKFKGCVSLLFVCLSTPFGIFSTF
jgi:hypothetical protein